MYILQLSKGNLGYEVVRSHRHGLRGWSCCGGMILRKRRKGGVGEGRKRIYMILLFSENISKKIVSLF